KANSGQLPGCGQSVRPTLFATSAFDPATGAGSATDAAASTIARQSGMSAENGPQSIAIVVAIAACEPPTDGEGGMIGAPQAVITIATPANNASLKSSRSCAGSTIDGKGRHRDPAAGPGRSGR